MNRLVGCWFFGISESSKDFVLNGNRCRLRRRFIAGINLIFLDFDTSFARYYKEGIKKREIAAISANLPAINNKQKLLKVRQAVKKKLDLMRKHGTEKGLKIWMKVETKKKE
ncbi:TPA: hypothetical protein DEA21_01190 [Candidatus Uhrbacteria bacterium]|nr:hypothetical protein [Candidatus Uhrbacteria bacterium]